MKPETLLRKLHKAQNDILRRVAWRIFEVAYEEAAHDWDISPYVRRKAVEDIRLIRSLRHMEQ